MNPQRPDAVVVVRLDDRLDLEIHRHKGVAVRIGDLHIRPEVVRDLQRALPFFHRRMPVAIEQREDEPSRFLRGEFAGHFVLHRRRHAKFLRVRRARHQLDAAFAERAV